MSDGLDFERIQGTNGITKPVNNLVKGLENLISETMQSQPRPDLLNGIHLWGGRGKKQASDVIWDT